LCDAHDDGDWCDCVMVMIGLFYVGFGFMNNKGGHYWLPFFTVIVTMIAVIL
jgi:hypothetical protein